MMKYSQSLVLAGLLGLLFAACGGDPLVKMEEFANQMCACEDAECVKQVNRDMLDWMKANADKAKEPNDADKKRAGEIMERLMKCSGDVAKRSAGAAAAGKPDEAGAAGGGDAAEAAGKKQGAENDIGDGTPSPAADEKTENE